MMNIILEAIQKGAKCYSNISGGKDGQAMTMIMIKHNIPIEGLVHADLGRAEWKESLDHCKKMEAETGLPLHIVKRRDERDLVDHWKNRMEKLKGTGKPFWSSSANRYCTSDLKRDPINVFYNGTGNDFIISCEGIRAQESPARAKKEPLSIKRYSSTFYDGMTVEEAVKNYKPGKKLFLTWFPIFNFSTEEVWNSCGMTEWDLVQARDYYIHSGFVPSWWKFHPAYVYGNERVSCAICVLASDRDIRIGAKHNPELYEELIQMEKESGCSFKSKTTLEEIINK